MNFSVDSPTHRVFLIPKTSLDPILIFRWNWPMKKVTVALRNFTVMDGYSKLKTQSRLSFMDAALSPNLFCGIRK